jgi:two-component system chemotaxis response regulator CheB
MRAVRIAIVDDSKFIREALRRLLQGEGRVNLVGAAATGEELLSNLEGWQPDVITLDLAMPGMGGLATLDHIMAVRPVPVIILSTHSGEGAPLTIEALSRGAVDFIDKEAYSLVDFHALREVLLAKIFEVASSEKRVRQGRRSAPARGVSGSSRVGERVNRAGEQRYEIVLLGASTGGPQAIERVLGDLGPHVSVPVAIVQHMPKGFTAAFADRLHRCLDMRVAEAADQEPLLSKHVYVAPAGRHLTIAKHGEQLTAALDRSPSGLPHRPSVDVLFSSAAASLSNRAIGVLLTGMGRDGAQGMAELARAGAYTIAQHGDSCAVNGMPQAAVALGAARAVVPLHDIGQHLNTLLTGRPQKALHKEGR